MGERDRFNVARLDRETVPIAQALFFQSLKQATVYEDRRWVSG
jgi:hypothetical protein